MVYRGFDVDELVAQSSFEEVTYLLWYGKLPTRKELDRHVKALSSTANRKLPPRLVSMLKLLPKKTTPMEVLRRHLRPLRFRPRCRGQFARGDAAEDHSADRADADPGRRVGSHPTRQAAGRAQPALVPRRQFSLHDERQEAHPARHQDLRRHPHHSRGSRVQ